MFLVALIVDIIRFFENLEFGGFFCQRKMLKNQNFQNFEHFQKSDIAVV